MSNHSSFRIRSVLLLGLCCLLLGYNPIQYATAFKASLQHRQHDRNNLRERRRIPTTYILFYPNPLMDGDYRSTDDIQGSSSSFSTTMALSASIMNDDTNEDFDHDYTARSLDTTTSSSSIPSSRQHQHQHHQMVQQYATLVVSLVSVSTFILINRFVSPWPISLLEALPEPYWLLIHYISGTMFAGTIVVSAILEHMIVTGGGNKNTTTTATTKEELVSFWWFHQVPQMDAKLVLPSVMSLLLSGTATSYYRYGSLALAPKHIMLMFVHLVAFLVWWAGTDITTQTKVLEWYDDHHDQKKDGNNNTASLQQIFQWRKISNIGSCLFLLALFAIMTLKPGTSMIL